VWFFSSLLVAQDSRPDLLEKTVPLFSAQTLFSFFYIPPEFGDVQNSLCFQEAPQHETLATLFILVHIKQNHPVALPNAGSLQRFLAEVDILTLIRVYPSGSFRAFQVGYESQNRVWRQGNFREAFRKKYLSPGFDQFPSGGRAPKVLDDSYPTARSMTHIKNHRGTFLSESLE
jgi:hypothetical protein